MYINYIFIYHLFNNLLRCYFNSKIDRTWMYKAQKTEACLLGELKKFIQAVENHARNEKTRKKPARI